MRRGWALALNATTPEFQLRMLILKTATNLILTASRGIGMSIGYGTEGFPSTREACYQGIYRYVGPLMQSRCEARVGRGTTLLFIYPVTVSGVVKWPPWYENAYWDERWHSFPSWSWAVVTRTWSRSSKTLPWIGKWSRFGFRNRS